jgi:hypothetical protein
MMNIIAYLKSVSLGLLLTACAYNKKVEDDKLCLQEPTITFATVDSILDVHGCRGCHADGAQSGGVDLDGLNKVKQRANTGRLTQVMANGSMPPASSGYESVAPAEIEKINRWICQGFNP